MSSSVLFQLLEASKNPKNEFTPTICFVSIIESDFGGNGRRVVVGCGADIFSRFGYQLSASAAWSW
ncbi:hypothetical protein N9Z53_03600 [Mariniblastus sp.]|nr:hypothetical protein [Mariniblastus sp.]